MTETHENFDVNEFQRRIIEEFRENGGKVSGMFQDATLALLTTTGARTGEQRTVPLGYLEADGKSVVVASAMGAPKNPGWYHNIRHDPAVTVEFGTDKYRAMAAVPNGDEYEKLWAEVVEQAPGYGGYQARTTRRIPIVVLHRLDPKPGTERVKGMGDWLVEVQGEIQQMVGEYDPTAGDPQLLRDELDRLTAQLDGHFRYEEETVVEALNATAAAPDFS